MSLHPAGAEATNMNDNEMGSSGSGNDDVDKSRIRDLLSSYYGNLDTATAGNAAASTSSRAAAPVTRKKVAAIDVHDFDSVSYVTRLARANKFNALMSQHNKVSKCKRILLDILRYSSLYSAFYI